MSTISRRLLSRTSKPSRTNSPLVTPNTPKSPKKSFKSSSAFEFETESVSSSSVFTDNEVVFDKPKKKKPGRRPRKLANVEDLNDYFKQSSGSTDSLDSNTDLKKDEMRSSKVTSKKNKKMKTPTIPDVTNSFKSDDIIPYETTSRKARTKKKIRHTLDLNAISYENGEADLAVKNKSKRTKKTRLPSFLPTVDMIEEHKKVTKSRFSASSVTDSENKENNTESTDTNETSRGRPRRAKRRLPNKNLEGVSTDEDVVVNKSIGQPKENTLNNNLNKTAINNWSAQEKSTDYNKITTKTPRKSILKQTQHSENSNNLSILDNDDNHGSRKEVTNENSELTQKVGICSTITSSFNVDISANEVEVLRNKNTDLKEETSEQVIKLHAKLPTSNSKSKRDTFEVFDSPIKSGTIINNSTNRKSQIVEYQNEVLIRQSKRNTSCFSGKKAANTPNKTGNTSDFNDESLSSETFPKQNNSNTYVKSARKSSRRTMSCLEPAAETLEVAQLPAHRQSTRNIPSNLTLESEPNLIFLSTVTEPTTDSLTARTKYPNKNSLNGTFTKLQQQAEQTDSADYSRKCTRNRSSSRCLEKEPNMEFFTTDPEPNSKTVRAKSLNNATLNDTFIKLEQAKETDSKVDKKSARTSINGTIIDLTSGSEEDCEALEAVRSVKSRRSTRNRMLDCTSKSVPNLQSFNTTFDPNAKNISLRTSMRASNSVNTNSRESVSSFVESDLAQKTPKSQNDITFDKRKSSFEVSFRIKKDKKHPEEILDHLNITRRDSKKSSCKKSTGLKYSTGSDSEDDKASGTFVTLRRKREFHTMIDFDTGDTLDESVAGRTRDGLKKSWNDIGETVVLSSRKATGNASYNKAEATKEPIPKKSILNKSKRNTNRDTFEVAEYFYETLENVGKSRKAEDAVPPIENTLNGTPEHAVREDIFDWVSRTPTAELGQMMIGNGDSIMVNQSFLNGSNVSIVPRLTRTSTFTLNKDEEEVTPQPSRRSTRKRWSQVERTPIFDKEPKVDTTIVADPDFSSTKRWNSTLKAPSRELRVAEKGKKSVKIETPRIRRCSPFITQSTPRPGFNGAGINILSENFAPMGADQPENTTLETTVNKSKTVAFKTPPKFSPVKQWNSAVKTPFRELNMAENEKKSVKTPRIRLHSPLVTGTTPRSGFSGTDTSILSGNCASNCLTTSSKRGESNLLKKVLTNEKSKPQKNTGKNSVRSKMPDFAKIHQRQYEKMENLRDLQERKAVRAQFLLSGSKPLVNTSNQRIGEKESRKQLNFSVKVPDSSQETNTSKRLSKPFQKMLAKRASLDKKKKEMKSKLPVAVAKPSVIIMPKTEKAATKPDPKGFTTRFGNRKATKEDLVKAVTTKSKINASRSETNRSQLVGVRSNRRFELLMKMREKNKLAAKTVSSRGFKYEPKKQIKRRPPKANLPKEPAGFKHIMSKPVQHMLKKKALKEKTKKPCKSKIPVHIARSKDTLTKVIKGGLDLEARGFTRFGFKLPLGKENVTKAEQRKAVAVKSKIIGDRTEKNRQELKKVRSNRRFELLMKMRGK